MGLYLFANQYQNETIPDSAKSFKTEWIKYYHALPENLFTYIFIDPAISQQSTADFTGVAVVSIDAEGLWYVRRAKRYRLTPTEILNMLFDLYDEFKPMCIGIEDVAFQKALLHFASEEMLRRTKYMPIVGIKPSTEKTKETRILGLVPRFEFGRVFIGPDCLDLLQELKSFPRGAHDDVCFVAGTKIATPNGSKNIEDLIIGDLVITPFGEKPVIATGNREKETINKLNLIGTKDHPVFTFNNGFVRLDTLTYIDDIFIFSLWSLIKIRLQILFFLMESNSKEWVAREFIISVRRQQMLVGKILSDFMSIFGKSIIEKKFQKALKFITKTTILLTTTLKTWSVYRAKTIASIIQLKILQSRKNIWNQLDHLHRNGTKVLWQRNFIFGLDIFLGKIKQELIKYALSVQKNLKLIFQRELSFVLANAARNQELDQELMTYKENVRFAKSPLKSTSIQEQDLVQSNVNTVYNITVLDDHMYFANNILVSNCDALAYIEQIAAKPQNVRDLDEEPTPNHPSYESWYIRQLAKRRREDSE